MPYIKEAEARKHQFEWDPSKYGSGTFSDKGRMESSTTLGILVNSRLNFQLQGCGAIEQQGQVGQPGHDVTV